MSVVGVGEVEDALLECGDLVVHLVRLDMGLELGEVVDGALAVSGSNHVCRVLPDIRGDFAPSSLDGSNGVSQSTVLVKISQRSRFSGVESVSRCSPYRRGRRRCRMSRLGKTLCSRGYGNGYGRIRGMKEQVLGDEEHGWHVGQSFICFVAVRG